MNANKHMKRFEKYILKPQKLSLYTHQNGYNKRVTNVGNNGQKLETSYIAIGNLK